jgi:hypothetical protein
MVRYTTLRPYLSIGLPLLIKKVINPIEIGLITHYNKIIRHNKQYILIVNKELLIS